ncbi:GNAT family N-acetyltransferase [Sporolactobacillus shoreae]|uniref:GNAT family N-acetyltransferase n=1 Tax=Sporolactobacillus shoreae TaxID=1465501 RepID=A0A4Z0GL39_9BACL|nr:GNAT family N-acetyltransferase [Sporolactobacillus shoreae]TGA97645.1 GNAT family N-acetyltransferase [Sporolactobacillus shoreae]
MDLIVRKAVMADMERIREIAEITWGETYKGLIPEEIQSRFLEFAYSDRNLEWRIERTLFFVAMEGKKLVGFANASVRDDFAELMAIYVLPDSQRCGIGSMLLKVITEDLIGISKMIVAVEAGNKLGESFYHTKGFKVVEDCEEDFIGYKLKTRWMEQHLQK